MVGDWASAVPGRVLGCVIPRQSSAEKLKVLGVRNKAHCSANRVAQKWWKRKGGDLGGAVTSIHILTSWSLLRCHLLSRFFLTYLKLHLIPNLHSIQGLCFVFFYSTYHHLTYSICYVLILLSFSSHQDESSLSGGGGGWRVGVGGLSTSGIVPIQVLMFVE